MDIIYWILIITCFVVSFIGLVYPIIPGIVFLIGGYLIYGFAFSFEPLHWLFWVIQILFVLLIIITDQLASILGVKRFGGSKAGMWGSTIGLLVGPFIIPAFGILLGPFIGAVLGEWIINKTAFKLAMKIGVGSVVGFIGSVVVKLIIQIIMIIYFFVLIW